MDIGLLPVFYEKDVEIARQIIRACVEGGSKVVEFTNRGDLAYRLFGELSEWASREQPDAILGAGTVVDGSTAALFISSGANFIVGPIYNREVAEIANSYKVPYIPGCVTPTEIYEAEKMGVDIVKVFPQRVLGPDFLRLMRGPRPRSLLMPSGGIRVEKEEISALIKAGAAALNIGTDLLRKDLIKASDFDGIRKEVERCILWIKEARGDPVFIGIDHVELYLAKGAKADEVSDWYAKTFGFTKTEGKTSYTISGTGASRLEINKTPEEGAKCCVVVLVSDYERACQILTEKGIKLKDPKITKETKSVFLKGTDPAGNRVRIVYSMISSGVQNHFYRVSYSFV